MRTSETKWMNLSMGAIVTKPVTVWEIAYLKLASVLIMLESFYIPPGDFEK
jgi:hypothetical protein